MNLLALLVIVSWVISGWIYFSEEDGESPVSEQAKDVTAAAVVISSLLLAIFNLIQP